MHTIPQSDPLLKLESRVIAMRKSKRLEIISKKREKIDAAKLAKEESREISMLYLNTRGLNSNWKQEQINEIIKLQGPLDIVSLSETKLTR